MSTDAVTPAVDTALLAAAATAELEDWGPLLPRVEGPLERQVRQMVPASASMTGSIPAS